MTEFKEEWSNDVSEPPQDPWATQLARELEAELQKSIDITIKRGVDKKYDEELGLTGRDVHQIILRLASALAERDEELAEFRLRTRQ